MGKVSPSTKFKSESAYNTELLDKCEELGIELIAVTDHWRVDSARGLIDAATARGIMALPGFEANTSEAVHLLVIFEAGTDFGDITAAIGRCGAKPGCENGATRPSHTWSNPSTALTPPRRRCIWLMPGRHWRSWRRSWMISLPRRQRRSMLPVPR